MLKFEKKIFFFDFTGAWCIVGPLFASNQASLSNCRSVLPKFDSKILIGYLGAGSGVTAARL